MNDNLFFKPTPLYKEYKILDLIEKDAKITQRVLSDSIGASVSMINAYLEKYENKGYLKRNYITNRTIEYLITKKGIERKKLLNIDYLKSSYLIYSSAKEDILIFLKQLIEKGFRKIVLYGAGEVAKIMLHVLNDDHKLPLEIMAVIDDEQFKQGKLIANIPIIDINNINDINYDGILISSYTHNDAIFKKLISMKFNRDKIISFFDV